MVRTRFGPVEVAQHGSGERRVLVFPGGHCTASTPVGQDLYEELGFSVLTVSRPGYGATEVGRRTATEFVPVVLEVAATLGIVHFAAVVGVSFGGLQALHTAVAADLGDRLVLHSCAPSRLPFPESRRDKIVSRLAFNSRVESLTWASTRQMVRSDRGLRLMMGELSTLRPSAWFEQWSGEERDQARATLSSMRSGQGFLIDVGQGRSSGADERERIQRAVTVPTLITASRWDGGASFEHAVDFQRTIPSSVLVETNAPSHFAWIGDSRAVLLEQLRTFLHGSP